jgi:hypothetical protein
MATFNTYLYRQQDGAIPDAFWGGVPDDALCCADVGRDVVSCTRAAFFFWHHPVYTS